MLPLLQIIHTTANHAVPYMEERGIIYAFPKSNRGKYCPDYTAKVFRRKKLADSRKDTLNLHPRTGGLVFSCALFRPAVVDSFLYFLQLLLTAAGKPEHVLI